MLFGDDTRPSHMLRKVRTAQPEDKLGLLAFSQYFGYIPGKRKETSPQERAGVVLAYQLQLGVYKGESVGMNETGHYFLPQTKE